MTELEALFMLFYTIGEMLTMTWPGRLILGMTAGAVLTRIVRS